MKRILPICLIAIFITACFPEPDDTEYDIVNGEVSFKVEVDWSDLPGNEAVAITSPKQINKVVPISIEDFGVTPETIVSFPNVSGFYYDIKNLHSLAEVGAFDFSIRIIYNGVLIERLTTINISDLKNTLTAQGDLSKIPIYTAENTGEVNLGAINLINQSITTGNLVFQIDAGGRDVLLAQAGEVFEIVFSLDLSGAVEKK